MSEEDIFTMRDIYFAMCELHDEINKMNVDTKTRLSGIEKELCFIDKKIENICGRQSDCDRDIKELQGFRNRIYGIAAVISGAITIVGGVVVKFFLDHFSTT